MKDEAFPFPWFPPECLHFGCLGGVWTFLTLVASVLFGFGVFWAAPTPAFRCSTTVCSPPVLIIAGSWALWWGWWTWKWSTWSPMLSSAWPGTSIPAKRVLSLSGAASLIPGTSRWCSPWAMPAIPPASWVGIRVCLYLWWGRSWFKPSTSPWTQLWLGTGVPSLYRCIMGISVGSSIDGPRDVHGVALPLAITSFPTWMVFHVITQVMCCTPLVTWWHSLSLGSATFMATESSSCPVGTNMAKFLMVLGSPMLFFLLFRCGLSYQAPIPIKAKIPGVIFLSWLGSPREIPVGSFNPSLFSWSKLLHWLTVPITSINPPSAWLLMHGDGSNCAEQLHFW